METSRAEDSIKNAVDSVQIQNEIIENTEGKFIEVEKQVRELTEDINKMNAYMAETLESSKVISSSIEQISTVSEQISAASLEGRTETETSMEEVKSCKSIFDSIYRLAVNLQESLHN